MVQEAAGCLQTTAPRLQGERERETRAPRGPSGLVTDANFYPLPCRLSGFRKDPTCITFPVQKTADQIFYLFTGKD